MRDKWSAGPRTYLGVATAGFPNLFTITGPGSPSVLSNMMVSIEQHVDFVADCINYLRSHSAVAIDPEPDAENYWVDHVNEVARLPPPTDSLRQNAFQLRGAAAVDTAGMVATMTRLIGLLLM